MQADPARAPQILLLCPATGGVPTGNRTTALRWSAAWRALGARVRIRAEDDGAPAMAVVALHAEKCGAPFLRATGRLPGAVAVLALGGTDLPGPEAGAGHTLSEVALAALERAVAIVVRHAGQQRDLPHHLASRSAVILPSAVAPGPRPAPELRRNEVVMLAHLRAIKAPFVLAMAMARLPAASNLVAVHLGAALDAEARAAAERWQQSSRRWRWIGPVPRRAARERLRCARGLVLASHSEGASQAVVEAIVQGVPVLASDIAANRALLGDDWPARFPVGDATALAALLERLEWDAEWTRDLERRLARLAGRYTPARERADWGRLFAAAGLVLPRVSRGTADWPGIPPE